MFDDHGLLPGLLKRELTIEEPDTEFEDDKLDYITFKAYEVELIDTTDGDDIYDITDEEVVIAGNINALAMAQIIHAETTDDDLTDASELCYTKTGNSLLKTTWANINAKLKTYFDTLYEPKKQDSDFYVTSTEKSTWNAKQDALGFAPENTANKSSNIETDKASTTKYPHVKALYDWATGLFIQLSKIVTSWSETTLNTNIPSEKLVKDGLDLKADISPSTGATSALRALFTSVPNANCVYNSNTGYYEMNGITNLTEANIIKSYHVLQSYRSQIAGAYQSSEIRTNFYLGIISNANTTCSWWCQNLTTLEVFKYYFLNYITALIGMFFGCSNLVAAETFRLDGITNAANANLMFSGCVKLVTAYLYKLKVSFSFADSPLLSLESLQYLVTNRGNGTTRITITVHATVWAKLNDAVNYPTWNALLVDAVANQYIDFASA
jgi:hypothetical protein